MKFAFVIHPLGAATQQLNALQPSLEMREAWGLDLPAFCRKLQDEMGPARERLSMPHAREVRVVDEMPALTSVTGATASGRLYEIPFTPEQLLADPNDAQDAVIDAIRQAANWGAEIVGLGALTGTLGAGGELIADQAPIAVTTGNSLTVYAAVQNVLSVCDELEIDLRNERLAVIGAPGSIAAAAARRLAPRCRRLLLVARNESTRLHQLAAELDADTSTSIPQALQSASLILTATSSGQCLDPAWLQPGSVVWDVGVPSDVQTSRTPRSDVLLLSSGLTTLPAGGRYSGGYLWLNRGVIPSCLGETLLLAFEDQRTNFSLGRKLDCSRIDEIGCLAARHQFEFSHVFSAGLPLSTAALVEFQHRRLRCGKALIKPASVIDAQRSAKLFARHMNPVLADVLDHSDLLRAFVRGEGCRLWDAEGREYLDFVSGFGSVNLGHNHPMIAAAVTEAVATQKVGFTPGSINPLAARLAEQLVFAAPVGLEMAGFTNSGAESVEAALKLARAATGRTTLVACDRGYHGKTCGALSVTGHREFRRPFEPLLPDCLAVPFGCLDSLARVLHDRQPAAFIVEPLAAEGGMHRLPAGYLRAAAELCRQAGTLFIVDEIQTGLGRTGRMFAVDHEDVTPDILCVAKSLGGGLVPIGAMLSRRDIWQRAYGTLDTCLLQTSTFAGGSLACAAALATLDVLRDGTVIANAAARGVELLDGMQRLAERYDIVREARGSGLLLGLEFGPLPELISEHWSRQSGLMPVLVPNLRDRVDALPAFYVMQSLLRKHGIFVQLCRSQPNVLRVEPPLTISSEEVQRFLRALESAVAEIELTNRMFEACLSTTVRGDIGPRA